MGKERTFDARRQATFVAAVERGAAIAAAAREAGVCLASLYKARRGDAGFAAAWDEAAARSGAPELIMPVNGRRLQKRKCRRRRFTPERKGEFLARFAASCDATAAAEAVGVSESAVYEHRRNDPDFAEAWQQALEQGYARLEAEIMRQRLEALARMKAARDAADIAPEAAVEFERAVKLLDRYGRRGGAVGPRTYARAHLKRWSFDEAMEALERKLRALGYEVPEDGGGDGDDAAGPLHHGAGRHGPPPRPGEDL